MKKYNSSSSLLLLGLTCIHPVQNAVADSTGVNKQSSQPTRLSLANEYDQQANFPFQNYWYSEKFDGIRAFWDGRAFYTRQGNQIHAPQWFLEQMPNEALDGELWAGRGHFHAVQQTVLDNVPDDKSWKNIQFMTFDLPNHTGSYQARYLELTALLQQTNSPNIVLVEQHPIATQVQLEQLLDSIEKQRGEGIMLRNKNSVYRSGRSDDLLKVKSYQDDEAVVVGYKAGNGKYQNMVGSLLVKWRDGKTFYLGSGLTDDLREMPPPIGSEVNFRYNGLTHYGLPRFARFVRVIQDK